MSCACEKAAHNSTRGGWLEACGDAAMLGDTPPQGGQPRLFDADGIAPVFSGDAKKYQDVAPFLPGQARNVPTTSESSVRGELADRLLHGIEFGDYVTTQAKKAQAALNCDQGNLLDKLECRMKRGFRNAGDWALLGGAALVLFLLLKKR